MKAISNSPIIDGTTKIKKEFHGLLAKANKEHPNPADVKALSDLLYRSKDLNSGALFWVWRTSRAQGPRHRLGRPQPGITTVLETQARVYEEGFRLRDCIPVGAAVNSAGISLLAESQHGGVHALVPDGPIVLWKKASRQKQ